MRSSKDKLALLRSHNAFIRSRDLDISEESLDLGPAESLELPSSPEMIERAIEEESIVMRRQRPVLAIRDNAVELTFIETADSEIWKSRLDKAQPLITVAAPAVGRIELTNSDFEWVGTGWLLSENSIVTNRHVAALFAARQGEGFTFQLGRGGPIGAKVDFVQEIGNDKVLRFKLLRPLHIEDTPGPDLAFFEIEMSGGDPKLAEPIDLADRPTAAANVATIGYPAFDSRIPEPDLMERIYGRIYNKKRLAPGSITRVEETHLLHDCTTLGGNSGSVVLDLASGKAVGLHFSGSFLTTNYAVRADVVKRLFENLRRGRVGGASRVSPQPKVPTYPERGRQSQDRGRSRQTITIPLNLTISVDVGQRISADIRPPQALPPSTAGEDGALIAEQEAVIEDYIHREGYKKAFLGQDFPVDLPTVERHAEDVVEIESINGPVPELRYQHFSVVMSRSRRMCFFSAVNINGGLSKRSQRSSWRWDPRLPKSLQIMRECYGDPPKFSRGHMTRREDPAWGDDWQVKLGNSDSMHVTNAVPQMQAFNSPIWLGLEDYALEHARQDNMKISVFTGPYFADSDPEIYGVRIPHAFWKVIAFVHDQTGKLCATGYEMSQEKNLPEEEFVFGQFVSPQLNFATQVPIRAVQRRSGIKFSGLADVDPLAGEEESLANNGAPPALGGFHNIRFVN